MSRVVLVTGASSGIGEAVVRRFARDGWIVAATMREPARSPFADPLGGIETFRIDVTDEASIADGVRAVGERFGRIDVLVNNAGYALMGPVEAIGADDLRLQLETNLVGLAAVTRHVLPWMRLQRTGTVVNVSSIGGRMAFPFAAAYHATKFAVEGLSEAMRFELKQFGIRVRLVEPGGIRTNFISKGTRWAGHPAYEPRLTAFRRMSEGLDATLPGPERVAHVVLRAATDRSGRLRYPAAPGPYLLMRALLPDAAWRAMISSVLERQAARSRAGHQAPDTSGAAGGGC